jgi:hypothetical protein
MIACGLSSPDRDSGGQPAPRLDRPEAGLTPGVYLALQCKGCHDQDQTHNYAQSLLEKMVCRMTEWKYYDGMDMHQIAFRSLQTARSREMVKQLGYLDRKATDVEACLACHAVRAAGSKQFDPQAVVEGVTCVACHGAYADWVRIHPESILLVGRGSGNGGKPRRIDWTDLSRTEKEQQFGMTDLWDPVRRAETCAACHVGKVEQGKIVTHAMYAAGHPPLPGFELATFGDAQPRHWQNVLEKTPERQRRFKPFDSHNLEQTQLVVDGALVVLREWMTLFADQSAATTPDPAGSQSRDFARFDCYACHHELQAPNGVPWRQIRRVDGHPGRPATPGWPLILIQLATVAAGPQEAAARENEFSQLLAEFHAGIRSRPFGDPARAVPAARKIAAWTDTMLERLNQTTFDSTAARQLLDRLCKLAQERTPDYDRARQIAWAFRVIYREISPDEKRDPVCELAIADLEAELALNLTERNKRIPIEESLPDRLRAIAAFDPESFQAHFETIAERLARPAADPPARR